MARAAESVEPRVFGASKPNGPYEICFRKSSGRRVKDSGKGVLDVAFWLPGISKIGLMLTKTTTIRYKIEIKNFNHYQNYHQGHMKKAWL